MILYSWGRSMWALCFCLLLLQRILVLFFDGIRVIQIGLCLCHYIWFLSFKSNMVDFTGTSRREKEETKRGAKIMKSSYSRFVWSDTTINLSFRPQCTYVFFGSRDDMRLINVCIWSNTRAGVVCLDGFVVSKPRFSPKNLGQWARSRISARRRCRLINFTDASLPVSVPDTVFTFHGLEERFQSSCDNNKAANWCFLKWLSTTIIWAHKGRTGSSSCVSTDRNLMNLNWEVGRTCQRTAFDGFLIYILKKVKV